MPWTLESETGVLRDVLLATPDHYAWQPTNSIARATLEAGSAYDHQRVQAQYRQMVAALEGAGVTCHYLKVEPHLPYQVYTRDSSQVTPWGPVITQLFRPQRRGEYAAVIEFYQQHGGVWRYATDGTLEGGDIHIIRPGLVLIGVSGERTNEAGARQFARWFEAAGWEARIEPFPEHFLHLDVIFCMAADSLAVACTDVLGDRLIDWLKAHRVKLIGVTYKEVMAMGCNLLSLGRDRVLSPKHGTRVNARLRAEGITVFEPELDLLAAGGGSIHCMTMPLRRDPV